VKRIKTAVALFAVAAATLAVFSFLPGEPKPLTWPEALEEYLGTPAYKTVDRSKPLHEQTSVFEMAGRAFEMPTVYISSNIAEQRELDGLNLVYVLPDYRSRADFANREQYEQARNERRFGHMLLQPSSKRPSFDVSIANLHHGLEKIESAGTFDGLEVEKWYQERRGQLIFYNEVYIERDDQGKVVSWIDCATLERPSARFPSCSHRFRDKDLLYKINYNKDRYLNDWRTMRASAIAFIESFEIAKKP